jgi:DNA-binding FadR family transcriptional regulator
MPGPVATGENTFEDFLHTLRLVPVAAPAAPELQRIRRAIAEGEAKPGERLPPAKDLAAVLGVNTKTVLRSLRVLRDEGLLEFRRGRGVSIVGTPKRGGCDRSGA